MNSCHAEEVVVGDVPLIWHSQRVLAGSTCCRALEESYCDQGQSSFVRIHSFCHLFCRTVFQNPQVPCHSRTHKLVRYS